MRIAIVSDIHGNLTALEAVLMDLRQSAPDLVLHGGDLAQGGASPAAVIDRVRELGWRGVVGNADELLFDPAALANIASQSAAGLQPLFAAIEEQAAVTRDQLGSERLAWLRSLPRRLDAGPMALVHASPESLWRAPAAEAEDAELERVYGPLGRPVAVYAHIHRSFVRSVAKMQVANTGSVSLSHDGDCRAAYLLLDGIDSLDRFAPTIRRVAYDLDAEIKALAASGLPRAEWIERSLRTARPQMP